MSVHNEPVPGSTQHSTQLGHGKSIGVLTHCGRCGVRKEEEKKVNSSRCEISGNASYHSQLIKQVCVIKQVILMITQAGVIVGQSVEHGVERANEEVVSQLHYRQPHQVPQEEPRQHTALEARH